MQENLNFKMGSRRSDTRQISMWMMVAVVIFAAGCTHRSIIKKGEISKGTIMATTESAAPVTSIGTTANPNAPHAIPVVLAILDFHVNSANADWFPRGPALTDLITARMATYPGFKVVERQRLDDILSEMKIDRSGVFDPMTVVKIGHMVGANIMVFGSLSQLVDNMVLSGRLVKVETGEIIGGLNQISNKQNDLSTMATATADQIAKSIQTSK
jgi:TolB-like protein